MKKFRIHPVTDQSDSDPERESAPLTPSELCMDPQAGSSDRGEDDYASQAYSGAAKSQFQVWDSTVGDRSEGNESNRSSAGVARHPGWATFDKKNLASMDCFGGMLTRSLEPCPKKPHRVIISNDGARAASYSLADTKSEVIVYDTNRGERICDHTCTGATLKCEFTDLDNTLYLCGASGLAIIDTTLGETSQTKLECTDQIHTFALRPMPGMTSSRFASLEDASSDQIYATTADSMLVCAVLREREKRDDYVLVVFEKVDGKYEEQRELRVNNENQTFSHHESIETVVFSGDGKIIASAGNDGIVRFWDPVKGPLRQEDGRTLKLKDVGSQTIRGVSFRPIKNLQMGIQNYEVTFFTVESACVYSIISSGKGSWRPVLLNNIDNCAPILHTGCTFNTDGEFLLVRGSDKKSAVVYDTGAKGGQLEVVNPRCHFKCPNKVTAMNWLNDSTSVVMFDKNGYGYIWSAEGQGNITSVLSHFSIHTATVRADVLMQFRHDTAYHYNAGQADAQAVDLKANEMQQGQNGSAIKGDPSRCAVDVSIASRGRFMVTLHGNVSRKAVGGTEVRLWDLQPAAPHVTYPLGDFNRKVAPLAIAAAPATSLSEGLVAIAGGYGKVLLWDVQQPSFAPATIFNGEGNEAEHISYEVDLDDEENSLYAIAWSPCGERLAISGSNEKVLLWHSPTMDSLAIPTVLHEARTYNGIEGVNDLAWSHKRKDKSQYLVAASSGKNPKLMVWKVDDSGAKRVTFGPTGSEIGLDIKHLMLLEDDDLSLSTSGITPGARPGAKLVLGYLRLECAEFSPPTYKGGEILLVGGETGLWAWDVNQWDKGDMGAGLCRSKGAGCSWVQQVKFSANGNMVAIAAEGQGVGVITTDDWICMWENWSEMAYRQRSASRSSLTGESFSSSKAKQGGKRPAKGSRRPGKGMPKQKSSRKQDVAGSAGPLKVNHHIDDMEPLDLAWGPGDETIIVGGELDGNQGIHVLDASNGNSLCTILTPRVHSVALALACKGPELFDYTGIIGVHSLRGNSTFVSVWTPYGQSGVTPDWMHYLMLRTNTIFPERSVVKHYPELQFRVDYTGRSILMHALEHMSQPPSQDGLVSTNKQYEDIVEEVVEIAPGDGYSITICNSNSTFQNLFGGAEAIQVTMQRKNTNFNVTIALCTALSSRKFRHSSRSHYIFWPLIQAMVTQYPAMLVTYLQDGMAPLGKFQWPVPALVGVNLIASYHMKVQETSTYSMWQYIVQQTMLITKMGIMVMKRHWVKEDSIKMLGHAPSKSVISSLDVVSRSIPRKIKPSDQGSTEMATGQTCDIMYSNKLPLMLRLCRKYLWLPIDWIISMTVDRLNRDDGTLDRSSLHTIPMQAFCFQLPGIGAVPSTVKYDVLEALGFKKRTPLEPGDFLRLLLDNPRVPLSVYGSYAVIAATELRWHTYAMDYMIQELIVHSVLVVNFSHFCIIMPKAIARLDKDDGTCGNNLWMMVSVGIIMLICVRKLYKNVRAFLRFGPVRFFSSAWRFLDVLNLILFSLVCHFYIDVCYSEVSMTTVSTTNLMSVSALICVIIWLQFCYFLLGFETTGPLVRMVIQIAIDMKYLFMLMIIIGIGFGMAFRLLFFKQHQAMQYRPIPDSENNWFEVVNLTTVMASMALGDWNAHDFRTSNDPNFATIFFLVYILMMTVVLLNLLIAIMGDSYDRVKDKEILEFLRGKVRLLIDMESQMEDYKLRMWARRSDRFVHFLVPAEEVQENETQEWLGRLKETEKKVRAIVEQSSAGLQRSITSIDRKVSALQMRAAFSGSSRSTLKGLRLSDTDTDPPKEHASSQPGGPKVQINPNPRSEAQ